ncbi:HNH endonuclease [Kitasatospora sp. NPDC088134]|uniref:HNH endonuclease n=1 Tax=Kitasatospora sp. NPDC088134 TaxID=3364071 RepID=UPI0038257015
MSVGISCCMYCGQDLADNIDHYIPVKADPTKAFTWLNYILACGPCNTRFKNGLHEVDPAGRPLLVDPTVEDPADHIQLSLTTGTYIGITERGIYTEKTCGLNEDQREEARLQAIGSLATSIDSWLRHWESDRTEADRIAANIRDEPFAGVLRALLDQALSPIADILFEGVVRVGFLDVMRSPEVQAHLRESVWPDIS